MGKGAQSRDLTRRGRKSGSGRKGSRALTPEPLPKHRSHGRTPSEPGSEKRKEKAKGRAGRKGRRVPGAGGRSNPPGRPCQSPAPARGEQGELCAGLRTRARGQGGTAAAPARHRPALVPPDKGDGGPTRVEDAGEPPQPPGLSTGLLFPRGAGMREVLGAQHPGEGKGKAARGGGRRGNQANPEGFL